MLRGLGMTCCLDVVDYVAVTEATDARSKRAGALELVWQVVLVRCLLAVLSDVHASISTFGQQKATHRLDWWMAFCCRAVAGPSVLHGWGRGNDTCVGDPLGGVDGADVTTEAVDRGAIGVSSDYRPHGGVDGGRVRADE